MTYTTETDRHHIYHHLENYWPAEALGLARLHQTQAVREIRPGRYVTMTVGLSPMSFQRLIAEAIRSECLYLAPLASLLLDVGRYQTEHTALDWSIRFVFLDVNQNPVEAAQAREAANRCALAHQEVDHG